MVVLIFDDTCLKGKVKQINQIKSWNFIIVHVDDELPSNSFALQILDALKRICNQRIHGGYNLS